ncbi:MAG: NAD-dependent epimerase/dehydratase family protein [Terriglobia bacterium]
MKDSQDKTSEPIEFRRALVTGAAGCIGQRLVKRLVTEGCHVHALDVSAAGLQQLAHGIPEGAVRILQGDLNDAEVLEQATEGVEAVFHAAAKVHSIPQNSAEEAEFFRVNVAGTEYLLRACQKRPLRAFVFFSTIAVYGSGDGHPLTETTALRPENAYAQSKVEAERRVLEFRGPEGMRPTVLRMSLVYGEGERGNFIRMLRGVNSGRFLLIGSGETRKSMIYVGDVVEAALLAARSRAAWGEVFVLADPTAYTLRVVVETLARHLGARPPRFRLPISLARLGGEVLTRLGRGFGVRPPVTRSDVDRLVSNTVCDTSKIQKTLGYQSQVGLEEGVRRTVRWFREEEARLKRRH